LEWEGKPQQVERLSLPFQTVETINQSRATRDRDAGALFTTGAKAQIGSNRLIWGDNRLVMSSLLRTHGGQVNLIYIDPPFDTGADFSLRMKVGDADFTKAPSVLEEHAYRDTWGHGRASYLRMLYDRIILMHELLTEDGTLYIHIGPSVSHYVKVLCDEIFGESNFRGELVWKRSDAHSDAGQGAKHYGRIHEVILHYSKSDSYTFNTQFLPLPEETATRWYRHVEEETGRRYNKADITGPGGEAKGNPRYEIFGVTRYWRYSKERMQRLIDDGLVVQDRAGTVPYRKRYLDESAGVSLQDIWTDVPMLRGYAPGGERTGYPTQKPEQLIDRLVRTSSVEGDLVADFFAGSGTTLAVAEKLGRRWIGCDLGRFAIHTTRKRLLSIPECQPFDIENLGTYERQRWQIDTGNGALRAYLNTILAFYRADPVDGFVHLHGRKANRMVHVGATDAPVTIEETEDVMDEMADNGIEACDLLGWEWEMGLHDTITERARRRGLDLRPRQIPREVMERQVTEADAVRFFELAHVDLDVRRQQHEACIVLKDFAIPSEDLIPPKVRERIESWSDLIDYWSVDFDFSDEVFHNQWQAYRTRENPLLATQSDWHEYPESGRYAIVVKIIDIFGNDTTKLAEVRIK
jgi:DNA modification methylase